ncbi:uncharacterized protein LOC131151402 [Malania oleifera]|uniref:uncharacterized protein LOC131151402 n=1 Tax=Malania oleifera TaxID=397392 RepID=UPI0025AE4A26|nr:uncharacterized protein LOC131151402 [Malania oleifera]
MVQALYGRQPEGIDNMSWKELEVKVVVTIRLCLADNVMYHVKDEESSVVVWLKLESGYMSKSLTKKLYLKKKIYGLMMVEGLDMNQHVNLFNQTISDLKRVDVKFEDGEKGLMLLNSLPTIKSRDNIANVGGRSSEGAGPKAGSDSTNVLWDFTQHLMAEVVQTNKGQGRLATELGYSIDQFTRLKPPVFMGSADLIQVGNWIEEIEKILDILNYTEKHKVAFAKFKLLGEAERWWKSVKILEEHRPIPVVVMWARFKELFFEWYFPVTVRNAKMEEFMSLEQRQLTIQKCTARFQELSHFAPFMVLDKTIKAWKF